MSSYTNFFLTTSLILSLAIPGYSLLANTPRTMSNATRRVAGVVWTILTVGITFAVFVKVLQVTLPALPDLYSLLTTSTSGHTLFGKDYSGPDWHAPRGTDINDLSKAFDGTGPMARKIVPKTSAGASEQPEGWDYADYNYCNMPHVTKEEYEKKGDEFELVFVEVIQRHHKRTPYATNTFPHETYAWYCDDAQLYQFGRPNPADRTSASGFWHIIDNDEQSGTSKVNPFTAAGFAGTCQFPQITYGGLHDSWQHGKDLYGVYHDMLHIIPNTPLEADLANPMHPFHQQVRFRVTNNPITSQVAGMALNGMFGITGAYPLDIQPKAIDSLEPSYDCPRAQQLFQDYGPGSSFLSSPPSTSRTRWLDHLTATAPLFHRLDQISGVDPTHRTFHQSWDHYFDSLSSRLCHAKPLPCNADDDSRCITQAEAEEVFRLGMWEYSHIYRDAPESLSASAASMGVWLAELS